MVVELHLCVLKLSTGQDSEEDEIGTARLRNDKTSQ